MIGPFLVMVGLPVVFAAIAGMMMRDWRIAVGTAVLAVIIVLLLSNLTLPGFTGIAAGAATAAALLLWRPAIGPGARAAAGAVVSFVIHMLLYVGMI